MDIHDHQALENKSPDHFWHQARLGLIKTLLLKFSITSNKNKQIVDIGCGTGDQLETLGKFGNVTAIDKDESALKIIEDKNNTIQADITKKSLETEHFDIACCFDVLEHIPQDSDALKNIYTGLKNNGILFITVPAYPFFYGPHDIALEHVRRYTKKGVKNKLSQANFSDIKIYYWNSLLFPLEAVYRLIKKIRHSINPKNEYKSESGSIPRPLSAIIKIFNPLFYSVLKFENYLISKDISLPFGLTLIAIAHKNSNKAP